MELRLGTRIPTILSLTNTGLNALEEGCRSISQQQTDVSHLVQNDSSRAVKDLPHLEGMLDFLLPGTLVCSWE